MAQIEVKGAGQSTRTSALDIGRGLAIVSVIYGHALAPWFMAAGERFSEPAFLQWKFGASFMMVFFFFLSGLGWREEKSLQATLRQSLVLIAVAWLASAAFDVFRLSLSLTGVTAALGIPPLDLVAFLRDLARMAVYGDAYALSALWFLVALAIVRLIASSALRLGSGAAAAAAIALMALTLAATELGWRNFYQVSLIGVAFLAFMGGHAARGFAAELEGNRRAVFGLLVAAGVIVFSTFGLNQGCRWDVTGNCGQAWLNGGFGVSMVIGQFGNLPLFFATAAAGVGFALALSIMLAHVGGPVARKLSAWGANSLNLLIVNAVFLHTAAPLIAYFIVPRIAADSPLFFVALFIVTMAINLYAAHALARPLRMLTRAANRLAGFALDTVAAAGAIVAWRRPRVSQSP
ncbi:MAG: hypothetical protein JNL81_07410 [Hyphomonadaceae bacterium]|nr:hypothetical protein [Hyphomonadaceae bacterium]